MSAPPPRFVANWPDKTLLDCFVLAVSVTVASDNDEPVTVAQEEAWRAFKMQCEEEILRRMGT